MAGGFCLLSVRSTRLPPLSGSKSTPEIGVAFLFPPSRREKIRGESTTSRPAAWRRGGKRGWEANATDPLPPQRHSKDKREKRGEGTGGVAQPEGHFLHQEISLTNTTLLLGKREREMKEGGQSPTCLLSLAAKGGKGGKREVRRLTSTDKRKKKHCSFS